MIDLKTEIDSVQHLIDAADPNTRYKHEPDLRHVIERLRAHDVAVPEPVKRLHQILLSEAIEAEFDNMPV
jgi:hypothetical protein